MDTPKYIRRPEMVHAILKQQSDGKVVTMKTCKIQFPVRYEERSLAGISNVVNVIGLFAVIVDDKYYGIVNLPATLFLEPSFINKVKVEDEQYYELTFEEGSTVFTTNEIVKMDVLTYYIYNEVIAGGNVPWYMEYSDLVKMFDDSVKYSGHRISSNLAITDMVISAIARNSKDLTKYYRHGYTDRLQEKTNPPEILALRNVSYGASNTTAKLIGSHFADGMTSALIHPSKRLESIEEKLRR